jgi:hypothetical protein
VCFEQPGKLAMLFDHVGRPHFLCNEIVDVEEHIVLVLVHIAEANGTLEPKLDSGKSDGDVVIATSRGPGLLVFLVVVVFLRRDLFNLDLRLGRFLPQERDSLYLKSISLCFPDLQHSLLTCESRNIYKWLYLIIKMERSKNRSIT